MHHRYTKTHIYRYISAHVHTRQHTQVHQHTYTHTGTPSDTQSRTTLPMDRGSFIEFFFRKPTEAQSMNTAHVDLGDLTLEPLTSTPPL